MKFTRLFLFAAALIGTAALLSAGPDSRTFMLPKTPAKTTVTANVTTATVSGPATTVAMAACGTCACCKKAE